MMFLYQKIEDTKPYKAGYEIGKWAANNTFLAIIIGIVLISGLLYAISKIIKYLRSN